jgi:hypothetical protein
MNEAINELPHREKIRHLVINISEPFQFLSIGYAKLLLLMG